MKFSYQVKIRKDGLDRMQTGNIQDMTQLKAKLRKFERWYWCNVFYNYSDNFDNNAWGQIVSYTPKNLPKMKMPGQTEVMEFLERMKKANGGEVRHLTYLSVCAYIMRELDGDLYAIGLDPEKFAEWEQIKKFQDIAFSALLMIQNELETADNLTENLVNRAIWKILEQRRLDSQNFKGSKKDLIKQLKKDERLKERACQIFK